VALLAEAQYGVFSRNQAAAGHTPKSIRKRLESGRWINVLSNVFGLVGVAHCQEQDLMAAHLWAGSDSVCCGQTSAGLWGACSLPKDLIDLCVPRKIHSPKTSLLLHRPVSLPPEDTTRKVGIPLTVLDRLSTSSPVW